jgi:DivIVA domain-containing protein
MDENHSIAEKIRTVTFDVGMRGYTQSAVDAFLREIQEDVASLEEQVKTLSQQASAAESRPLDARQTDEYKAIESELSSAKSRMLSVESRLTQVLQERDEAVTKQTTAADELARAMARVDELERQLKAFDGVQNPELISKVLIKAQESATEIEQEAKDKANAILEDAQQQQATLIEGALASVASIRDEGEASIEGLTQRLKELQEQYEAQLRLLRALGNQLIQVAQDAQSNVDLSTTDVADTTQPDEPQTDTGGEVESGDTNDLVTTTTPMLLPGVSMQMPTVPMQDEEPSISGDFAHVLAGNSLDGGTTTVLMSDGETDSISDASSEQPSTEDITQGASSEATTDNDEAASEEKVNATDDNTPFGFSW